MREAINKRVTTKGGQTFRFSVGGGGGRGSDPPASDTPERRLQMFLFLSTVERKEWKLGDCDTNRDGELVRGERGER